MFNNGAYEFTACCDETPTGGGSGLNITTTPDYPTNCNGFVHQVTSLIEVQCGCGDTWLDYLAGRCAGCSDRAPTFPSMQTVVTYQCLEFPPASNPTAGGPKGGGGTNSGSNPAISFTSPIIRVPLPPEFKTPCAALNELKSPTGANLNNYISELANLHANNAENEASYSFKKTPVIDDDNATTWYHHPAEYRTGGPLSVAVSICPWCYAAIHLHPKAPKEAAGIFSWKDVRILKQMNDVIRPEVRIDGGASLLVLAPDPQNLDNYNVYAIKVENYLNLDVALSQDLNNPKWNSLNEDDRVDEIQAQLGNAYVKNKDNLEYFFLKRFENYGIALYKLENGQWNRLLKETSKQKVIKIPCQP